LPSLTKIPPVIRRATIADAAMIADLGARTFFATFAKENTPEDMRRYLETAFTVEEIAVELADPAIRFLVAEFDSKPAGYAQLYAGEAPSFVSREKPIELARLYAEQDFIGCGVGAALMQACLDEARGGGYKTIYLGVWERNERAQAFYHKWGFKKVGEQPFILGEDEQTDWVMERPLTTVESP
jgi:diamine N-acetyltransferase